MLVKMRKWVEFLCLFVLQIHSVCNRTKLHHCALLSPHESPWVKLYCCGDVPSFPTMTGMTRQAFTLLNDVLLLGQQPQSTGQGRHQPMDPTAQSGLFLFFIWVHKHLCLIFGATPAVCSRFINQILKLVVKKLRRHPLARVLFPNAEQMEYYTQQWMM
jgi:hypothetical protein